MRPQWAAKAESGLRGGIGGVVRRLAGGIGRPGPRQLSALLLLAACTLRPTEAPGPAAAPSVPSPTPQAALEPISSPTPSPSPTAAATPTPPPTPPPTPDDPLSQPPTPEDLALAAYLRGHDPPERDYLSLAASVRGTKAQLLPADGCRPRAYKIGDRETFWILESDTQTSSQVEAVLTHISQHAYLWTQAGLLERTEQMRRAAEEFDRSIYPTNRRLFGEELSPGVDCDPRLHILHADGLGQVTGYYKSVDQYPPSVVRTSNRREMFYMSVEHAEVGEEIYLATLAHEFQHMIQWRYDGNEDLWLNEGLAELAMFLNGLDAGLYTVGEFLRRPNTPLTHWPVRREETPHYGAGFLFSLYLWEQFGPQFVRDVVQHPANGIRSLDELLEPYDLDFDALFADWLVANYLEHTDRSQRHFHYRELRISSPTRLRWTVEELPFSTKGALPQYGAHYIRLAVPGELQLEFQGSARLPLLPTRPHSGRWAWWSDRGDSVDSRLTRAFDLTGLEQAHLRFRTWYSLEQDLDFVHLMVSTDGGRSWKAVKASNMVDPDPLSLAMGYGYTGTNPPVGAPDWTAQVANLSDYVGQEILVRFQMLTDAGVHQHGFYLDDIEIPELGYHDDVEEGDGGWKAEGFVRSHNFVPQQWIVRLVSEGEAVEVTDLSVDAGGRGSWQVEGVGGEWSTAVLVISPVAPRSSLQASYRLSVERSR